MSRRSREIGWGPSEIMLWEIDRALTCTCVPTTTLPPVSDARLKTNLQPTGLLLHGFKEYTWDWTEQAKSLGVAVGKTRGVLADDVLKTSPDAVIYDDKIGYYRVNYNMLKKNGKK